MFKRRKDLLLTGLAGLGIVAVGAFCFLALRSTASSADDKKWAQTVLAAIVSGIVGYIFGKKSEG